MVEEQEYPGSTMHDELHPSPDIVLPSSHLVGSVFWLIPSPQTTMHTSGEVADPPTHENPGSIVHVLLHPSPLEVLPSSQMVEVNLIPSPQVSNQEVAGLLELLWFQVNPVSSLQFELQPSVD